MAPVLSLITGTLNRPAAFRRLLDSIIEKTVISWELIVGDACEEQTYTLDVPENVTVFHEKPRLGHSKGYNKAFRMAKGEYLLWLNDDAEVCEGYADEAVGFMEDNPQIGLGALHYSENGGPFHVNSAWDCMYANFGIFRKDVGEKVGYFDEEIQMYGADNSIAFRMLLAGYGIADIPEAKILHHSVSDRLRQDNQANRYRDNKTLQYKYLPLKSRWLPVYLLHRRESVAPWSHGVAAR